MGKKDSSSSEKKSKKPEYTKFSQQELPAQRLILTPGRIITVYIVVGLIFMPIGLALLFASESVVEIVDRYDNHCIPANYKDKLLEFIQNSDTNKTCTKKFTVPKHMKSPIYIYYQIENYYQNHRRYAKSRSDKQLRLKKYERETKTCRPERETKKGETIVPCGMVAWTLFNDTYKFTVKDKVLQVNKKNIAWESDRNKKFGSGVFPQNFQSSGGLIGGGKLDPKIPLSQQEDLIVWMRTSVLSTFRKLYGKIEVDIQANDIITVEIQNNYNTYGFEGKKSLVLSTTSWMGGKNDIMAFTYITISGICLFFAIFFILLYVLKPRQLGDPTYLSWNRNSTR